MWPGTGLSLLSLSGLMFVDHRFAQLPTETSCLRVLIPISQTRELTGLHLPTVTANKWQVQDLNPELPPPHHFRGPFPSPSLALVSWSDLLVMSI